MGWGRLGSQAGQTGAQVLSREPREVIPWAPRSHSPFPGGMPYFRSDGDVFSSVSRAVQPGAGLILSGQGVDSSAEGGSRHFLGQV